jgi:phage terminase large subunit-like protein
VTTTRGVEVARWMMATLPSPGDTSEDLRLTSGQIDFLVSLYAQDPAGRYVYRRAALSGAKGIGKSPLAAMIALAEFAGPVAPKSPLVQVAALSEEQADSTVYSLILELVRANDRRVATALGIDDGRGRLYLVGRPGKLEAVTSAAGSHEGERTTFAILDESHLWTKQNGGQALARTIRRNVGKLHGRTLELSNAHEPGRGSVAEATEADHAAGRPGILFVARRPARLPDPEMTDAEIAAMVAHVYADCPWIDLPRILAEIRDPASPWDESVRYFMNTPSSAADVLVDPAVWASLATPGGIPDGSTVAIGFDGSHNHDGTAIVVCDEAGRLALALLIERKPTDPLSWTVPRQPVHDTIADLFARFAVRLLYADPFHWQTELDDWAGRYGEAIVVSQPTNSYRRFGPAIDRFRVAIAEGTVTHNGDADLARHLANARLVRGPGRAADDGHQLYTLEKAGGRLMDAAAAAVLAHEAMAVAATAPKPPPPPDRRVRGWS